MAKIGIDFGTTNSCLVAYDKKSDEFTYFHREAGIPAPFPSVVCYHGREIVVGKEAKKIINKYSTDPGHCIVSSIKSKLGSDRKELILGTLFPPFKIAADIIQYLKTNATKEGAEQANVELHQAVFTVPINFDGKKRADLRQAAREAGIEVLTFIHEPFAALIGYFFHNQKWEPIRKYDGKYFLVFDWGGGTLDVTVAKADGMQVCQLGTSELSGRAGDAFDRDLLLRCWNRFIEKHKDKYDETLIELAFKQEQDKLLAAAERCKISLSKFTSAEFDGGEITFLQSARKSEYEEFIETITREEFEQCIQGHVEAAIGKVDVALKAANINAEQISLVLLTGGSSQIPIVEKKLRDQFSHRVRTISNPDTVIAEGAAVVAEMNWKPFLAKDIMVELSDGSYWTVFSKGTPLITGTAIPTKEETFTCVDMRDDNAKIILCEGSHPDTRDKGLGVLNVPLEKKLEKNMHDEIKVCFDIDGNFIMSVKGHSIYRGYRTTLEVHDICFGVEMR